MSTEFLPDTLLMDHLKKAGRSDEAGCMQVCSTPEKCHAYAHGRLEEIEGMSLRQ